MKKQKQKQKYYNCFSHPQKLYLEELGFKGEFQIHRITGKRFWKFEITDDLRLALTAWSTMKRIKEY